MAKRIKKQTTKKICALREHNKIKWVGQDDMGYANHG